VRTPLLSSPFQHCILKALQRELVGSGQNHAELLSELDDAADPLTVLVKAAGLGVEPSHSLKWYSKDEA
jgi:hypothetical protein